MKFITIVICLTLCATEFQGISALVLNNLKVPSMVLLDGQDDESVTLDCEFEDVAETESLVVKWFKDNEAVYQWIRGKEPNVFPAFRDKIDSTFDSLEDSEEDYRKLTLLHPDISTSGSYKCTVQTARETISLEKILRVVDISSYTLNLYHHKIQNETHLECVVDNVYPEPKLDLTTDDDDDIISIISFKVNEDDNGLFNATIVAVVDENEDDDDDHDDDIDSYKCTVVFEGLPLNLTTSLSSSAVTYFLTRSSLLLPLLILFYFYN